MTAKNTGRRRTAAQIGVRASMVDVAAAAGVSRSAVSLALQGHPSIPPSTRESIMAVARRLGYRKNPLVAALMSIRRKRGAGAPVQSALAFLISHPPADPWPRSGPLRRFQLAAEARAAALGFSLEAFSLGNPEMRPERVRALLKARGVHGVLIAPLPGEQSRLDFDVTDFSAVGLGLSVKEPGIDRVSDDHFLGAQLAFAHALALGYRRIGLALAANISRRLEHRWWSGYLVAQQRLPARSRIPALMPETREEIPAQLKAWIARHEVDAVVFSIRHESAMACAPAGVGLISLSVNDSSGSVAGIRQNEAQVGEEAIERLVAKLHRWSTGATASPRLQLVQGTWSDGLTAPGAGRNRRALN